MSEREKAREIERVREGEREKREKEGEKECVWKWEGESMRSEWKNFDLVTRDRSRGKWFIFLIWELIKSQKNNF